jgi:tRNA pseudouridine32 synthase/23S rRNA pseudouridine746 synthase
LVLFALTKEAHRSANGWFEKRSIKKAYEALTEGPQPPESESIFVDRMLRGKKRAYASAFGKEAATRSVWVGEVSLGNAAFQHWSLHPLTGRSHQLRFQLASRHYPIVGDQLYGATHPYVRDGIALRAISLNFSGCPGAYELGLPASILVDSLLDTQLA